MAPVATAVRKLFSPTGNMTHSCIHCCQDEGAHMFAFCLLKFLDEDNEVCLKAEKQNDSTVPLEAVR